MADMFYSTGDAVNTQLQSLMAQRRAEARQNMLDQLNAEKVHGELAEQKLRYQSLSDAREAQADERRVNTQKTLQGGLTPGQDLDPSTAGKLDPSMVVPPSMPSAVTGINPTQPPLAGNAPLLPESDTTGASALSVAAPQAPTGGFHATPRYLGNQTQLQHQDAQTQLQTLMSKYDTPDQQPTPTDILRMALLTRSAGVEGSVPFAQMFPPKPPAPPKPVNEETPNIRDYNFLQEHPGYGEFLHTLHNEKDPNPPREPNPAPQMFQQSVPDPEHPGQMIIKSFWVKPGQMTGTEINPGGGGAAPHKGNIAPPPAVHPSASSTRIDPGLLRDLTAKMGIYNANKTNQGAVAGLRQAQMAIVTTYPGASSTTKALATHLMQSTDDPTETVIRNVYQANPDVPPDQLNALSDILYAVRGK